MYPTKPPRKEDPDQAQPPAVALPAWVTFVDQVLTEAKGKSLAGEKEKHA